MKKYLGALIGFSFGFISTWLAPYTFALFIIPMFTAMNKMPLVNDVDLFESGVVHLPNYWLALIMIGIFWALMGTLFQFLIIKKKFLYMAVIIIAITYIFRFSFDKFYEFNYIKIANSKKIIQTDKIPVINIASGTSVEK